MASSFALILSSACGGMKVENPSGNCETEGDGSRVCAHSPDKSDIYLKDCQNPLGRDYWRVFAQEDESAYIIPRPDGTGLALGICDGDDPELSEVFERSGLCDEIADLDLVNHMALEDAMIVSTALHGHLIFQAKLEGGGWRVVPYAPDDELDYACRNSSLDLSDAAHVCELASEKISGGICPDIGLQYTEVEARLMAQALNETFGIPTTR